MDYLQYYLWLFLLVVFIKSKIWLNLSSALVIFVRAQKNTNMKDSDLTKILYIHPE